MFKRFFITSIVKSFVGIGSYYLLYYFFNNSYLSFFLSFILTLLLSVLLKAGYVFNSFVTFRVYYRYVIFALLYLMVSQITIYFIENYTELTFFIPVLVPGLLYFPSFFISKKIFKND